MFCYSDWKIQWESLGKLIRVMEGAENRPGNWQVGAASAFCASVPA